VISRRLRRALLICGLTLAPLAVPGLAAAAEKSSITTPGGLTSPFGETGAKITIAGTAEVPTATVDIRCYTGGEGSSLIASSVPVTGGAFSVEAPLSKFYSFCQLRAVPHEAELSLPPETTQIFEGPLIAPTFFNQEGPAEYYAASDTTAGSFIFESAGHFALESELYSHAAHEDAQFFFGEADLTGRPPIETRSSVQVDGANAYVPRAAVEVAEKPEKELKKALPGKPEVTGTRSYNAVTHQLTIHEEDPLVKCSPENVYPPTAKSCTGFVPTGVTLARTWEETNEDRVAWMTETWRSTNGAAHSINARYYTEMFTIRKGGGGAYEFPGEGGFSPTHEGETKTIAAGAGAILYKRKAGTPAGGDGENPQGAIVYDIAPTEPISVTTGSAEVEAGEANVMEVPYQRTVPAGGSSTLRMTFVQAFGLPEVQSLAAAALASYRPSVSISSPANGATVASATPSVTVSGSASDTGALASLSVNGAAVAVGAGGAWTTSVPLKVGANAITANATDQAGLTSSASVAVTYAPPAPPPPPVATASQIGNTSAAKGQVKFTLACHGVAGTSCKVHVTLTTVEKTRHGHLIGIQAAKTKSTKVTVASLTVVIPAGQRVTITLKLNATGRKLLKRFGKLPSHLTAILEHEGGRSTVIAQNLTVKPVPKKHKH